MNLRATLLVIGAALVAALAWANFRSSGGIQVLEPGAAVAESGSGARSELVGPESGARIPLQPAPSSAGRSQDGAGPVTHDLAAGSLVVQVLGADGQPMDSVPVVVSASSPYGHFERIELAREVTDGTSGGARFSLAALQELGAKVDPGSTGLEWFADVDEDFPAAVSYTHLTLPTILLV